MYIGKLPHTFTCELRLSGKKKKALKIIRNQAKLISTFERIANIRFVLA